MSVPVKEKKSKNHRKERKEKGPADDFKRSLLVRFTLVTEKIDEKNTEKKRKDTVSEEACLFTLVTLQVSMTLNDFGNSYWTFSTIKNSSRC